MLCQKKHFREKSSDQAKIVKMSYVLGRLEHNRLIRKTAKSGRKKMIQITPLGTRVIKIMEILQGAKANER